MSAASRRLAHRVTTRHLQAAYPAMAEGGLGGEGVYIGRDVFGSAFVYDPWTLNKKVIAGPNMLVVGQVGYAKSSLVKTYLWRQQVFSRRAWVIDPKGEYLPLAVALGAPVLRLRPWAAGAETGQGPSVRLNPLDPTIAGERQLALLEAIAAAKLGRKLAQEELTALGLGHARVTAAARRQHRVATLPQLVEAMLRPAGEEAALVGTTPVRLAAGSREAALGLRGLTQGHLRGMFDGPTTAGVDLDAGVVVVDLSAVLQADEEIIPILMLITAAWLQGAWSRGDGIRRIVVLDEAWRVLNNLATARWLRAAWKLARQYQVQMVAVTHRFSDLAAAGAAGSEQVELARGLLSDSETRVVYNQPPGELAAVRELLGLSSREVELVSTLGMGEGLWKVGQRSFLVRHRLSPYEEPIVDTTAGFAALDSSVAAVRSWLGPAAAPEAAPEAVEPGR